MPVGFEVLTAVVMNSYVLWDITPCSPFHLQGRRISHARNQSEARSNAGFLLGLFFDPEDGGDMFFRNLG
jgi:hypothetical protein